MGIQFSGTDSKNPHVVGGRSFPSFVEMAERWEFGVSMSNCTGRAFLTLLGLPFEPEGLCGACTLPEARRAVMQARATFTRKVNDLTISAETLHGRPRQNEDGVVELRPFRGYDFGVDADRLQRRLDQFADFIEAAAAAGADGISWG